MKDFVQALLDIPFPVGGWAEEISGALHFLKPIEEDQINQILMIVFNIEE